MIPAGGKGPVGRSACLAQYDAQIHEFRRLDTQHRRGAPGGSHQADRMSGINLTESHHQAEAVTAIQVKLVGSLSESTPSYGKVGQLLSSS